MDEMRRLWLWVFLVFSVVLVASASVLHSIPTVSATGTVRLLITDPPKYSENVTSIRITFTQISLNQVNSTGNETWIVLTSTPVTIDLIQLINVTESLGNFSIPVGNYSQIRFIAPNATATIDGKDTPLIVPSGDQTGLKVHFQPPFQLIEDGIVSITIDITVDDNAIHNGILRPSMQATVTYE